MSDDEGGHLFDKHVWREESYWGVPIEEYAHTFVEMEEEVNQVMTEGCKLDACLDWFISCLEENSIDYGSLYDPSTLETDEVFRLEEMKKELRENLNRLIPGYLDGESDILTVKKLTNRLACRWHKVHVSSNIKAPDAVSDALLDTLMEKYCRQSSEHVTASSTTGLQEPQQDSFLDSCLELKTFIEGERATASYACGGSIPIAQTAAVSEIHSRVSGPINIFWSIGNGSARRLSLPLRPDAEDASPEVLQRLIASCGPASFGRGEQNVMDLSYRKAGKLDPESFATSFHPADFGIIEAIEKVLLPGMLTEATNTLGSRKIYAELYKMNIYSGPSGLFRSHVDTPRSQTQVGSLVVCLPARFKGGNLLVRHQDREVDFDWAAGSEASIQWAAFYSDCEHEIKTITEGDRITLTYNLYVSSGGENVLHSIIDPKSLPLYGWVKDRLMKPGFLDDGGVLGIFCSHAYPHTANATTHDLPGGLKGSDMVLYSVFQSLGLYTQVLPVLENHGKYIPENPELGLKGHIEGHYDYIGEDGDYYFSNNLQPYLARNIPLAVNFTEVLPQVSSREDLADIDRRWKLLKMTRRLKGMAGAISFAQREGLPYTEKGPLAEEGARVGSRLRPYDTTELGNDMPMDEVLHYVWPAYYLPGITWLTEPKHEEMAFSQVTYGNDAGLGTRYSCAAILAVIPPWDRRDTLRGNESEGK
ncbi:hypothetical protein ANOM_000988 [Aspergillus nomiae NRRL 13137]|uniref:Fe2OG dioxygenase domain-containing protein n=1 Tax=Aspergillus nomiae NRRL (strain ATCC 15546 / NRRL 13137 / CBS 260.88 / M93) TaxID=1509407 RepID=A0A0L1JGE7_ASPN3|nr:uncharacterized protein ANOM_000988 [Aspergillus nomiae NRRL 13137]KNG90844.1 hypothetical protein ANOM_000988 [Aspergillus nomiae NRRL 13137]